MAGFVGTRVYFVEGIRVDIWVALAVSRTPNGEVYL
jgi:hypothetical protein